MPARRKRDDLVQDRRPNRTATLEVVATDDVEALPAKPKWLKKTKQDWVDFWAGSISAAVEVADRAMVYRLFDLRDRQARAWIRYDKQPYVDGSQGQPRANPAMADAMALEKAIIALEDRLGLSPKARAQLGVTFGQAQLSAAELNRMALESGETDGNGDQVVEAELLDEWGEA